MPKRRIKISSIYQYSDNYYAIIKNLQLSLFKFLTIDILYALIIWYKLNMLIRIFNFLNVKRIF